MQKYIPTVTALITGLSIGFLWLLTGCERPAIQEPTAQHTAPIAVPALAAEREGPHLEPTKPETDELAELLGIYVRTFRYSGGRVRCWLEIDEGGKNKVQEPTGGVQDPNKGNRKAEEGRILLCLQPGLIKLQLRSGVSSGGLGLDLPPDKNWWGWKSFRASTSMQSLPATPTLDQEYILLTHEATEDKDNAKDPKAPRKVTLVLKAVFPSEQPTPPR